MKEITFDNPEALLFWSWKHVP